ncbi:hypothetical protein SAMN02745885_01617 [Carboxydocella sporoproducens DSM 16521]|uniref:Uncharacterized protein n=2 Tax=Carboxydocella TaxID=178898 RepID=A0A1T4QD87_9FIRM|nr:MULTISPECIES: hypothetical protein [Carboxydocella]AVX21634.1 hypothetical protein CFE_2491 [Carboxydocella thermautotrophica]SKA01702.1 hypothetical protein SAMN02745885_01617 [Carboxydocella sporoproducens DSM 16521]
MIVPYNEITAPAYDTIAKIVLRMVREADNAVNEFLKTYYPNSITEKVSEGIVVTANDKKILVYYEFSTREVKQQILNLTKAV